MHNDPKHAKLMLEYAERLVSDPLEWKNWQFQIPGSGTSGWMSAQTPISFSSDYTYRRVSKHPHAELMLAYALDAGKTDTPWEMWEETPRGPSPERWMPLQKHPRWSKKRAYRRKSNLSPMAAG